MRIMSHSHHHFRHHVLHGKDPQSSFVDLIFPRGSWIIHKSASGHQRPSLWLGGRQDQWLWNGPPVPKLPGSLNPTLNILKGNPWARGPEHSADNSLTWWLGDMGLNYSKFPFSCKMLWFWRSLYRTTQKIVQSSCPDLQEEKYSHFIIPSEFLFLIHFTYLLDTYYVKDSVLNALKNRTSATKGIQGDKITSMRKYSREEMRNTSKFLNFPALCLVSKR